MAEPLRVYWDANGFLSYLHDAEGRGTVLDHFLTRYADREDPLQISTSVISLAEVAFTASEGTRRTLRAEDLALIDLFWTGQSAVRVYDVDRVIALRAHDLMRAGLPHGWRLKPHDAIHLATAAHSGAAAFHTYDQSLWKYGDLLGVEIGVPVA